MSGPNHYFKPKPIRALGVHQGTCNRHMMILTVAMISVAVAFVAATASAERLSSAMPDLHKAVDSPAGGEWWPFWVFHFLWPSKWRQLAANLKFLVGLAICGLTLAVVLIAFLLLRFAASGGSL